MCSVENQECNLLLVLKGEWGNLGTAIGVYMGIIKELLFDPFPHSLISTSEMSTSS